MILDITNALRFVDFDSFLKIENTVKKAHDTLENANAFNGWMKLPENYKEYELNSIVAEATAIRKKCDIFIVIGIGGSYLGARAAIEFLHSQNYNFIGHSPKIFFIGNSVSGDDISELLQICENQDVCINIISKSGTTLEPAVAFRIFKNFLEKKYGKKEAANRIYCTTDYGSNLQKLACKMGYKFFEIPKNIGGRYSVLTPVGLLPIAVSGADIRKILDGAADAMQTYGKRSINANDCYKYAAIRNILYKNGKNIEILIGYHTKMRYFLEWWKQLFGESEGKNRKGIFPVSALFSTDLHSLGQYIQDGHRFLFETTINVKKPKNDVLINKDECNADDLNYLSGKNLNFLNQAAMNATISAHVQGNVPNIIINVDEFSEYNLGYLIYFFEKSCAISSYILGVDPFNQPGVENYKRHMYKLLRRSNFSNLK